MRTAGEPLRTGEAQENIYQDRPFQEPNPGCMNYTTAGQQSKKRVKETKSLGPAPIALNKVRPHAFLELSLKTSLSISVLPRMAF